MEKKFELVKDRGIVIRNSSGEAINLYAIRALKTFSCQIKIRGKVEVISNINV